MSVQDTYLRRGALAMAGVTVGGYLVDYAFNLGLTRFLSSHDYGDFKVAFSFGYFFGLLVLLGGDRAAPRVLAPKLERGATREVGEYLRFYVRNALGLGLAVMAITWVVCTLHSESLHPKDHHPLLWASVAIPLNAAGAMVSRTLQAARRPAQAALPWRIGLPLAQLALFAATVTWLGRLGVAEAIAIGVASVGVVLGWQWHRVRRLGLVDLQRDPQARQPQEWLTMSLPMMGSFLVALALNQSDLYFLELLGDDAEVGHYAAAAMAAHFVPLIQVTMIGLIAPLAGPAIEAGPDASRQTFLRSQGLLLGLALPIALLLALVGEPILALFGPEYRIGHATLQFLLLGNAVWAAAAVPSLWLQYQQRAVVVLKISIATLVVDSALNLLLIPRFGMVGAAAGTAATLSGAGLAILLAERAAARA